MSLKQRLERLYETHEDMAKIYPFEQTYEQLDAFLNKEVTIQQNRFLSHTQFAKESAMTVEEAVSLFFLIANFAEDRILTLCYRYTCSQGTDHFLHDEDLEDFQCDEDCYCGEEFNLKEAIVEGMIDIPVFFEAHADFKEELEKEMV